MRICCFGDLHYGGSREWLASLAENIIKDYCSECNVAVVVGDVSSLGELKHVREALELIKKALDSIPILVVPGNHDIYVKPSEGIDSIKKLELFNKTVENIDCIPLMKKPFILNSVGFVGSIGWYDYSFAPDWLGLLLEDFKAKAFGLSVWADREYVKLPFSDEEFTQMLLNRFEEDIKRIYDRVDKIVAVLHHVPFRQLVEYRLREDWDYFSTFMGSEAFGHIIKKYSDKIRLVVHGHQHSGAVTRICREISGIKICNCASPILLVLNV